MLKDIYVGLSILLIVVSVTYATDYSPNCGNKSQCLDKAYRKSTGDDEKTLNSERTSELNFVCTGEPCCQCGMQIVKIFEDDTKDITQNRVNPATDNLVESLRNQYEASDLKIKELVNLKFLNSIYSFYDKKNKSITANISDNDHCMDFSFDAGESLRRDELFREGILLETLKTLHYLRTSSDALIIKNCKGVSE